MAPGAAAGQLPAALAGGLLRGRGGRRRSQRSRRTRRARPVRKAARRPLKAFPYCRASDFSRSRLAAAIWS